MRAPLFRSALLPYDEELEPLQRRALRAGCVLGAILIVAFSGLDWALAPQAWVHLLVWRLSTGALLASLALWLRSEHSRFDLAAAATCLSLAATICAGTLATGGVYSSYPYAALLVLLGVSILLPLKPVQALCLHAGMIAVTLLPLIPLVVTREDQLAFASRASYLLCGSVLGIAGARLQDGLRRREHLARAEFARHVGLVNLGTLAGGLAHELATPLTALSAQLELLELELPAAHRDLVSDAQGSAARMRAVIEAMRRGAGFSDGDQRDVDLSAEIEASLLLLRTRLGHAVQIVREYGAVPPVRCQPTLLGQVVVNLVANAADALRGRPDARLSVRTISSNGYAVVEVEDNGPGVPLQMRERIFEPFITTKGPAGNGLGLWISAEIARRHRGSLTVHGAPGGGAIFRLALPLPRDPAAIEPERRSDAAARGSAAR